MLIDSSISFPDSRSYPDNSTTDSPYEYTERTYCPDCDKWHKAPHNADFGWCEWIEDYTYDDAWCD